MYEIWKDIPGYEGIYQVSNIGRIKSLSRYIDHPIRPFTKNETIRKLDISNKGYFTIFLRKLGKNKKFSVHRVVAETFIPNLYRKPQVNHKNGIQSDNHVDNLEWCTASENHLHKYRVSNFKMSIESINKQKIKLQKIVLQYDLEGNYIKDWDSAKSIQKLLGIQNGSISKCCNGKLKTAGGFIWKFLRDS